MFIVLFCLLNYLFFFQLARRARVFYSPRKATPCEICEDNDCTKMCVQTDNPKSGAPSQFHNGLQLTFIIASISSILFVQYFNWYDPHKTYIYSFFIYIIFIYMRNKKENKSVYFHNIPIFSNILILF